MYNINMEPNIWTNFWEPIFLKNGYKKTDALIIIPIFLRNMHIQYYRNQISWYIKKSFIIGLRPDGILHFVYGSLGYDPTVSYVVSAKKIAVVTVAKGLVKINEKEYGFGPGAFFDNSDMELKVEKSDEILRLVEAIPDDLALCIDINWATPLIEAYFKGIKT
jgi:hypothetical protein